mgnify:CR=1 FL=1
MSCEDRKETRRGLCLSRFRRYFSAALVDFTLSHSTVNLHRQGGDFDVMGPQGNGFDLSDLDNQSQVLLVGGGIGVPPLLEVAKELHARGVKVVTVLGFANKDAVILETELAQYGQVFVTTDDGSYGIKGNVSVVINDLDSQFDAVYSCGAPGMMKYINQRFYDHPRAYLSLESRMACGMGACYACVLKVPDSETVSQRVCEDGPVFRTGTVVL